MSNSQQSGSCKAFSPLRVAVAGAVALILLGSSFSAVRGGTIGGYNDDGDDGVDGAVVAGAVVGGGAAIYFIAAAIEKEKDKKKEGASSGSPDTSRKVESVRLSPQNARLERGAAQDFQVQARYAGETTWQTVTSDPRASVKVADASGRVVALDGAKNVFTAPVDAKGGPATVQVLASFAGVQATSTVAVQ